MIFSMQEFKLQTYHFNIILFLDCCHSQKYQQGELYQRQNIKKTNTLRPS